MTGLDKANFVCRGCGACCRIKNGIVRVGDAEIRRIAAFLGMSEQSFIDRETELAPDRRGLVLKSRPDDSCAFLGEDNRCRIHPVKPDKCRTFPYEWTNPDSVDVCPSLRSVTGAAPSAPLPGALARIRTLGRSAGQGLRRLASLACAALHAKAAWRAALAFGLLNGAAAFGDARPETWFHVICANASKAGAAADVKALAEAGFGGIQFFHGGWDGGELWPGVTEGISCLSPKWADFVGFLADECAGRGLSFKMQNCAGWSMSGGPWVTPERAMRKLVAFPRGEEPAWEPDDDWREIGEVTFPVEATNRLVRSLVVPSPRRLNHDRCYDPDIVFVVKSAGRVVARRRCPRGNWDDRGTMTFDLGEGYEPGTLTLETVSSHPVAAFDPVWSNERKLDGWEAKAGWTLRDVAMSTNAAPLAATATRTLVFGHVNAKVKNHPAPPEGRGWECDKMDPRGIRAVFEGYLGALLKGPLADGKLKGVLLDSWECGSQTWTEKMEDAFLRRNGYRLRPWLPALFGHVIESEAATERFLVDWRRTCSGLVEENYYGEFARLAHANGLSVQFETAFGDVIPGDPLRYWKYADEPMCEFWSPFDDAKGGVGSHDFKPVRPCVSAAHLYGKRRVSAEAFTSIPVTFDENFQMLKENANRHFARGVTHLVFHTYTHNPVVDGLPPGTSFGGPVGTPFLRLQPWWPYLRSFNDYVAGCGEALETGLPVVDVLRYLGDAAGHRPNESGEPFGDGYKCDYLNQDALLTRLAARDGRLVFPDGLSYRALWIPDGTFLLPETETKLAELARAGARIVRGAFAPDWPADVVAEGDGRLLWYHRRDSAAKTDVYFLAADGTGFTGTVRLRDGGSAPLELDLARGEARIVRCDGRAARLSLPGGGDADARGLPEGGKAAVRTVFPRADGWRDGETTKTFSFRLAAEEVRGVRTVLDLGKVCHWATVTVNGRDCARLWCEPYRCDLTDSLTRPDNLVEIAVTTTIRNRLVLDAAKPEAERTTWTRSGPKADAPLSEAGLFGPVVLRQTPVAASAPSGVVWLEAEDFADLGGWRVDTQFVAERGSACVLAPGVTGTVAAASTAVRVNGSGAWHVWARTRDWRPGSGLGRLALEIDGRRSADLGVSGRPCWCWEKAGVFELAQGVHRVRLVDLSGWYARCDAVVFASDAAFVPPEDAETRARLAGKAPPRDGGLYDVVVVGAGPAGATAAIASARAGARTLLVHDRPVLGGNASSEIRMKTFGAATRHPAYRVSGIEAEVAALEKGDDRSPAYAALAAREPLLTVVHETRVVSAATNAQGRVASVLGLGTRDGARTRWRGKVFVDATGDGWLGHFAGAKTMSGREAKARYGEPNAPETADGCRMGGCLVSGEGRTAGHARGFVSRRTGRVSPFARPAWAPPVPADFKPHVWGPDGAFIEHPQDVDELADPEAARDELIVMGVSFWDWLKNRSPIRDSPEVAEAELVGIPWMLARREGRRLVGDVIVTENDLLAGREFPDAVARGGYPITTHDSGGSFTPRGDYVRPLPPVYSIPLRALYSCNVSNLLMCGRCISVTHRALGSTRVQSTCAETGEAAGRAAAECARRGVAPADLARRKAAEGPCRPGCLEYGIMAPETRE